MPLILTYPNDVCVLGRTETIANILPNRDEPGGDGMYASVEEAKARSPNLDGSEDEEVDIFL